MKKIMLILSFFLMTHFIGAQIIHVPTEHSSIQAAIDASAAGDTVLVSEGTYFENINFRGKAITVASKYVLDEDWLHVENTIIDGSNPANPDSGSVVTMFSCKDTTSVLKGFTITGGRGTKDAHPNPFYKFVVAGGGVVLDGGKIESNIIKDNHVSATYYIPGGGISVRPFKLYNNAIIRNNVVYDNTVTSSFMAQGAGIYAGSEKAVTIVEGNNVFRNTAISSGNYKANAGGIMLASNYPWEATLIVRNNYIHNNKAHCVASHGGGIFLTYASQGSGYKGEKSKIEIYNNIIANNYSQERGGGIAIWDQLNKIYLVEHPNPLIYNNTITGNTSGEGSGFYNFDMNPLLLNNIIWNNEFSEIGEISVGDINYSGYGFHENHAKFQSWHNDIRGGMQGTGNINANPYFEIDTFELDDGSPCIGSGIPSVEIEGSTYFAPVKDYFGNPRPHPVDNNMDIGAIESEYITAIWQINNPRSLSIYPNPTSSLLTIETDQPDHHSIEIIYLSGQLIYKTEMEGISKQIDLTPYSKGIYFVRVRSKEGVRTEKVVKL